MSDAFEATWDRVTRLSGATFSTVRGKHFSYEAHANGVNMTTTNRLLPRSDFQKAFERLPVSGPGALQDLQGPSYVYAILTDPRVRP